MFGYQSVFSLVYGMNAHRFQSKTHQMLAVLFTTTVL